MSIKKWKTVSKETAFHTKWTHINKYSFRLGNGKIIPEFYIEEGDNEVLILGITKDGKIPIAKQYRPGADQICWCLPGGKIDPGENPKQAIMRELLEETGFKAKKLKFIAKFSKNPSKTKNFVYAFIAKELIKVGEPKLDHGEEVELDLLNKNEVLRAIKTGKMACTFCISSTLLGLNELD